jgi:Zn-dependent peptidase ImmA (M78 family)
MSIAHELGHLVMHKPIVNPVREIEEQAFQFAAEFLMPANRMRLEIVPPVTLDTLASLKQRWGTSIAALILRARDLEIIKQRKYMELFQQLSARGWRTREPRMFDVAVEKPRAVRQIAEIVYGEPIRYKKLAEDVGMRENFVRAIIEAHSRKVPEQLTAETEKPKAQVVEFGRSKLRA